jgi:ATP-dependent DNA ligase
MASKSINITDYEKEIPGGLSADKLSWNFPQVKTTNQHGKLQEWDCYVELYKNGLLIKITNEFFSGELGSDYISKIHTLSGQEGGKKISSVNIIKKGKNLGKKNATNPFTQALRDALSKYNKKLGKTDIGGNIQKNRYPPMLISGAVKPNYSEKNYIQPKLDGVHVVAYMDPDSKKVQLYSRTCNTYSAQPHIVEDITPLLKKYPFVYLDGEMYKHGEKLQDISGAARGSDTKISLNFFIFDCFIPKKLKTEEGKKKLTFDVRRSMLEKLMGENLHGKSVRFLPTYEVISEAEADKYYNQFIDEGYEGAIVRRAVGTYTYSWNNYHSRDLMKLKPFFDKEYEIVGFGEGKKGKDVGAIIWKCKAGEHTFTVVPNMEYAERYKLFKKLKETPGLFKREYEGKMYTVKYTTLSKDGVPQQPKGIVIRDYE